MLLLLLLLVYELTIEMPCYDIYWRANVYCVCTYILVLFACYTYVDNDDRHETAKESFAVFRANRKFTVFVFDKRDSIFAI